MTFISNITRPPSFCLCLYGVYARHKKPASVAGSTHIYISSKTARLISRLLLDLEHRNISTPRHLTVIILFNNKSRDDAISAVARRQNKKLK